MKKYHALFAATAIAALFATGAAWAQAVGIGTGPQASLTNRIGSAIAKVIADGAGLKTRAVPHTANSSHVPLVDKGTLSFGVNSTQDVYAGTHGVAQFKDHKTKNWMIAARMVPLPVGILVRADSPYKTLRDLKGKKFTVGYTAQKTVRFILDAYILNAGMKTSDFVGVRVPNTSNGTQLFLKGQVDATLSSLGGSRLRSAQAKTGGIRILKMFTDAAAVKAMRSAYPGSYQRVLKPSKKSIGVDGPTAVMAFDMFLMTSIKTPAEVVYQSVKALHAGKAGLIKIWGGFRGFKPSKMTPVFKGQTYHPGAIKFYKEIGTWPPQGS